MQETTIRDYIGNAREITAEKIRSLPEGSKVVLHKFDRHDDHCTVDLTVIRSGKKKVLMAFDYWDGRTIYPIRKETDRMCYTRAEE